MQPFSTGERNLSKVNIKGGPNRKNEGPPAALERNGGGEHTSPAAQVLHLGLSSLS